MVLSVRRASSDHDREGSNIMTATPNIPAAWLSDESAWEVEGYDFVDKADLVNIPLRITGLSFRIGKNDVEMVFCEAEKADGTTVQFSDSSTGIKAQISDMWLSRTNAEPEYTKVEKWNPVTIVVRHGLRVSEYQREGVKATSKTYYLRASGKRASDTASAPLADGVASGQRRTAKQ